MFLNQNQKERTLFVFATIILILYLSPLFILGENAHIRIHDNLDSNLSWYKVLTCSGEIQGPINSTIPQVINNQLSRNAFSSEFSGIVWLYAFFPNMVAYVLSQTITRVIAFIGMYVLLKHHFLPKEEWTVISIGVSLAFALTPFWPSGMLSTLGMPLALWAFLNIRKGEKLRKNYFVLTLIPLYSSIVLGFFFFLSSIGILWLVDLVVKKEWNFRFLFSIIYMTLIYMIVEYRLVTSFFLSTAPNSRDEYFHARLSLWRSLRLTVKNFLLGHTHVMTVHTFVILPTILIALYFIITTKRWKQEKVFIFLFWFNIVLSIWYAFWFYKGWLPLTKRFHILDTFNFARYHFLRPLVIYVLFALGLKVLWLQGKVWRHAATSIIIAQIILLCFYNEEIVYQNKPSVKEFFAEKQFKEIKEYIGLSVEQYRIANIGLHPAIAQYNGFYTLDTYNNFYPLSYKYEFRKIIEKELAKNKTIRAYFDEWGGRCYIFTDELGKHYMFKKNSKKRLKNVELNIDHFKKWVVVTYFLLSLLKMQ